MNIELKFSHKAKTLVYSHIEIPATCDVRTLKNGRRKKNEVAKSIPSGKPYDPELFPLGEWVVFPPEIRTDEYKKPYFIPTSAYRIVNEWHLDEHGNYDAETKTTLNDIGYGLHYSTSSTTLGCIRIGNINDLLGLVEFLKEHFKAGSAITLKVVE